MSGHNTFTIHLVTFIFTFLYFVAECSAKYGITSENTNPGQQLREEFYRHKIEDKTLDIDTKFSYYDSLINLDDKNKSSIIIEKALAGMQAGQWKEALSILRGFLNGKEPLPLSLQLQGLDLLIECLYFNRLYEEGAEKSIELLNIPKPDSLAYYDALAYLHLDNLALTFNLLDQREIYRENLNDLWSSQKLETAPREARDKIESRLNLTEISFNTSLGNNAKSLELIKNTMSDSISTFAHGKLLNEMGVLLCQQKDYEKGSHFFRDALPFASPTDRPVILFNWLMTYYDRKLFEEMISNYEEISSELEQLTYRDKSELLMCIADASAALQDYEKAFLTLKESQRMASINDSIKNNISLTLYPVSKSKADQDSKQTSEPHHAAWAIILLCVLLAINEIDIFISKRKHKVSDKEISDTSELQEKLDSQNRELAAMTMQIARLNASLTSLRKETENNSSATIPLETRIKNILKDIDSQENIWESWLNYFEDANKDFFTNLYRLHPGLSKAEIKMSAYCLMGLSVKEIATITNRSTRTIESIRYSLRKKLGITENTESFMRRLASSSINKTNKDSDNVMWDAGS